MSDIADRIAQLYRRLEETPKLRDMFVDELEDSDNPTKTVDWWENNPQGPTRPKPDPAPKEDQP
jgi:hypothetical protein